MKIKIRYTRKARSISMIATALAFLIVGFQNCSPGFDVDNNGLSSLIDGSSGSPEDASVPDVVADPNAPLSVYVRNLEMNQGEDLVFNVELNKLSDVDVIVNLETRGVTAMPEVAFEDTKISVTIPAGQMAVTATVPALNFVSATSDQVMKLVAVSAAQAQIAQRVGTATIKATFKVAPFKQIISGLNHSCGLNEAGQVKCWGYNQGTLGNNGATDSGSPSDLGLTGVKSISSGGYHTCAITATDTVKCWGLNGDGQLGTGDLNSTLVPVDVVGLTGVKAVATGRYHTCVITATDTVKCWGRGTSGELGNNMSVSSLTAVDVSGLVGVKSIVAGTSFNCAILATGAVACWGAGDYGQLGNGVAGATVPGSNSAVPIEVASLANAKMLSAGTAHACAITATNTVKCWGYNFDGQVGVSTLSPQEPISDVAGLTAIKSISARQSNTCVVTATDTVKCWGSNLSGLLGSGTSVAQSYLPIDLVGAANVQSLAVGGDHACLLLKTNSARCWGSNVYGNLGNTTRANSPRLLDISSALSGTKMSVHGVSHTCFITATDTVKCFGRNVEGQLGNGTFANVSIAAASDVGLTGVKQIVAGAYHTCALLATNAVKCWGLNSVGQLGLGSSGASRNVPTDVVGLAGIKALASRANHVCAITATDTVKCWGSNANGQVGDGSKVQANSPSDVMGLVGVTQIAAGFSHSCAMIADGSIACWGANANGQLGNNSTTEQASPVAVTGLTGAKSFDVGFFHACAVTATDTLMCWGSNSNGQLGNGTFVNSTIPAATALTGVKSVSLGALHSCAVATGDILKCWGSNAYGQTNVGFVGRNNPNPADVATSGGIKELRVGVYKTTVINSAGRLRHMGRVSVQSNSLVDVTVPL
jgi:alpha-tubulin suppressor-like RCC1 family protein